MPIDAERLNYQEVLNHADLVGMPDVGGSNADHDSRYLNLDGETIDVTNGTFNMTTTGFGRFGDVTVTGAISAKTTINTPEVDQNITAAGDTLSSSATHVQLNPNADYVMTSTPTIAAGVEGQLLMFENISAFDIDLQDDSVLAGSDIFLGRAEGTIAGGGVAYLFYTDSNGGGWCVLSNPNTAALGADATLLEVRNATGTTIVAGKPVYISGYNVGQGRPTVALADADDSSKMPAIGIVAAAIADGSNGDVITSGGAVNIIDTSGQAINAGVYIGTTAGELVYSRPTGATTAIQRIGTVARANLNNGVVIITGAGRQNDEENITEAYIFVGNANEKPIGVAMGGEATIIADGTVTVAGTHAGSAHHAAVIISNIVYGPTWNFDTNAASKNALFDKIETLSTIDGGAGTDTSAIHTTEIGEITTITEKEIPVPADILIMEDSENGYRKKRVEIGNIISTAVEGYGISRQAIINGNFDVWVRGDAFDTTGYTADRWLFTEGASNVSVITKTTFTVGQSDVPNNPTYYLNFGRSSTTNDDKIEQRIEDVRTLANGNIRITFWAKSNAASGDDIEVNTTQNFGSGGSADVSTAVQTTSLSIVWAKYSYTFAIPSISGKTVGADSFLGINFVIPSEQDNCIIDIAQVIVNKGATELSFSPKSITEELAACRRYYYLHVSGADKIICNTSYYNATYMLGTVHFPVTMRKSPALDIVEGTDFYQIERDGGSDYLDGFFKLFAHLSAVVLANNTDANGTSGHAGILETDHPDCYIAFDAEL